MLQVNRITKRFLDTLVLDGVSLRFEPGSVTAILGHNGAGKTAFLKILCGIYSADEGNMMLDGRDYRPLAPLEALEQGVSYVPQIPYLPTQYNILDIERLTGLDLATENETTFLSLSRDMKVATFTIIERQLLECQLALARTPRVLLLDEPRFFYLEKYQSVWQELVNICRKRKTAVIVVTHDAEKAVSKCDSVVMFELGQIRFVTLLDESRRTKQNRLNEILGSREVPSERLCKRTNEHSSHLIPIQLSDGKVINIELNSINCIYGGMSIDWDGQVDIILWSMFKSSEFAGDVALLPGYRADRGLALEKTIEQNLVLSTIQVPRRLTLMRTNPAQDRSRIERITREMGVQPQDIHTRVGTLSGGNKQRVAIAKLFIRRRRLLLCSNLWRGLDESGILLVDRLIQDYVMDGGTVVILTEEINELQFFSKFGANHWFDRLGTLRVGLPVIA